MAALVNDTDVAAFMEYLTTAEAGQVWAEGGTIISPIVDVDTSVYPTSLDPGRGRADHLRRGRALRRIRPAAAAPTSGPLLQSALRGDDMASAARGVPDGGHATAWESE